MRDKMFVLGRKFVSSLALMLGTMPFFGAISAFSDPAHALYGLVFPVVCLSLGFLSFLIPGKKRPWYTALALLLYAGVVLIIVPQTAAWYGYLCFVPGAFMLVMLPPSYAREIGSEWNTAVWSVLIAAGLVAQTVFYTYDHILIGQALTMRTVLAVCFALHALLGVITLNRQSMDVGLVSNGQKGAQTGVSRMMNRRNKGAVVLLFLAALIVSSWKSIEAWLMAALNALKDAVIAIFYWIGSLRGETAPAGGGGGGGLEDMMGGLEAGEPSLLALILEKIAMALTFVAVLAALFFLFRFLFKKLRVLVKRILEKLRIYAKGSAEDYVDETESIFDAEEVGKLLGERIRSAFKTQPKPRKTPWHQLDARGKVRYLYRCFWERHPKQRHMTAREALMQENTIPKSVTSAFADLYDQARYSDHPIREQDAEKLKSQLKY